MPDEILPPKAVRTIESFRHSGYSYPAAFADIIDNSISAGAKNIHIDINLPTFSNDISICFYDDGCGMNEQGLVNAMLYGSTWAFETFLPL